jgi:hypothetical protein
MTRPLVNARGSAVCLVCLALLTVAPALLAAQQTPGPSRATPLGDEGTVTFSFFPGTYTPGSPVKVLLSANQFTWGTRVHIVDRFPDGWSIGVSTPPATLSAGTLVWDLPLVGPNPQTVFYYATPPAGTEGIQTFHHKVVFSSDSTSQQTEADRIITRTGGTCTLACTAVASPGTGQAPLTVGFTATAAPSGCSGSVVYDWDFGDGSAHSAESSPTHTYQSAGSFTWTLTTSLSGVSCTRTGTISVSPACTLACAASGPATVAAGSPAAFLGSATPTACSGRAIFDWDFGDHSAHSSESSPSHTYTAAGTFDWRMTVSIAGATCSKSGSVTVTAPCSLACRATAASLAAVGVAVAFTGSATATGCAGAVTYDWDFGDHSSHSSVASPAHSYASAGSFAWQMTASADTETCRAAGTVAASHAPSIEQAGSHLYLVDTSGHASGSASSVWVSDLVIHNPQTTEVSANLYFLKQAQSNAGAAGRAVTLPAGASRKLTDTVLDCFGESSASGAILIGAGSPLLVTSRTYNNAATGTYGQYVEGVPASRLIGANEPARLLQLTRNTSYRTNIGFANATGTPLAVQTELWGADGARLGTRSATVDPYSYFQENDIFAKIGATTVDDGYAVVSSATPGARFLTYASVIDNRTNDPIHVVPARSTAAAGSDTTTTLADPVWVSISEGITDLHVRGLVCDPGTPGTMYVASYGGGVFKTTNGGTSWGPVNTGLESVMVKAIAIDPLAPQTLYVGTWDYGVYKTVNGGASWSVMSSGLGSSDVTFVLTDPLHSGTVYAGAADDHIYKTTSGGTSWSSVYSPTFTLVSLGIDPLSTSTLYAGNDWGIDKSINGGTSWTQSWYNPGWSAFSITVDRANTSRVYAGGSGVVAKSTSAGASWSSSSIGGYSYGPVRSILVDPATPSTLYAGAGSKVYKSTTAAATWAEYGTGLTDENLYSLVFDPANTGTLYAATEGGVFKLSTGVACTFALSPSSQQLGADGGTASFTVTASAQTCTWTASAGTAWITVTAGSSGTGNGTVSFSVAANTGTSSRTGTITAGGQTFTVNQAGVTCSNPAAPTLTAPTAASSAASYTLSWTGTSPDGTYELQESTDSGFAGATSVALTGTSRSTSHTAATATTWYSRVRAVDICGGANYTSSWSNVASTVVGAACSNPSAPTLTAPSNASSGASFTLSWTGTSPDGTYELQESTDSGFAAATSQSVTGTTWNTSHTASAATTWYARVRAVDTCGGTSYRSSWSNVGQTVVGAACATPPAPTLTAPATASSGASYTLTWSGTSPDGTYELQESTTSSFAGAIIESVTGTSRSTSHTVPVATTFYSRVRATEACNGTTYRSIWSATGQTAVAPQAPNAELLYLPAGAHATGNAGTNWRTDLEVHNPGAAQARFTLELLKREVDNSTPQSASFTLDGGQCTRFLDVLGSSAVGFQLSGAGTIRITPEGDSILATSRTYNDQPTGTFGQFIPGQPQGDAIPFGAEARLIQLAQSSATTSGFRTNLGMVNATARSISVEVTLYTGDGTLLGAQTYPLPPFGYKQVDKIFTTVTTQDVADGFAVLRTPTPAGSFFAYASVIDNRSGDPIYIPARIPE